MIKTSVATSNAPKKIVTIQFSAMDSAEIERVAELQVSSRELFQMPNRDPAPHGCMDSRLGISDKRSNCQTCKYVVKIVVVQKVASDNSVAM